MKRLIAKILLFTVMALLAIGLSATLAQAENTIPDIPKPPLLVGPNPDDDTQVEVQEYFYNEAIPSFIAGFLGLISGVALLALIWAGIQYIISMGEEEAITKAKKTALWAVLGFVLALLAYALVSVINTISFPNVEHEEYTEASQETVIYEDI